jgi:hypothetical protein
LALPELAEDEPGPRVSRPTKKPESVNGSPLEFSMVRLDWSEKLRDQKPEQEEHGDGNDEAQKACDGCINLYAPFAVMAVAKDIEIVLQRRERLAYTQPNERHGGASRATEYPIISIKKSKKNDAMS